MLSLTQATPQYPHLPLYFLFCPGQVVTDRGNHTRHRTLYYTMQQAKDKGCGSKISRGCSQLPGAPLDQLSALDSLRTPRHDLTCMGVLPRKHRPVGVAYSSPLAVTQKGQMSRMTKALQRLCMTPTAPTALWHTSIALFTPPQHLCTPRDHRGTVVHDHSAYPHHHSAITHPWDPRSAVAHSHSTLPQPHINLAHHFRLCRQSWQPLAMHPCFHKSAFLLDPSVSPFSYSASSASYSLET